MLDLNRLYLMDCMDGMREFPDKHFELAICDPPYGININHNMGRRKGDKPSDYKKVKWDGEPPCDEYFKELIRVSQNQIVWGGNYFTDKLSVSKCWLCWDKGFSEDVSFASFELAWTSFDMASKRVLLKSAQALRIHPTQKPIALYKWLLKNYAKPSDKILDTHVGSASSLIACEDMGFEYIGFEIDKDYYKAATKRLEDFKAQVRMPLGAMM
jgi:site-specific DNA-methyltransferase (adenine-specific)